MPRSLLVLSGALLLAVPTLAADPPQRRDGALKIGDPIPPLAADVLGQSKSLKLDDLRGKSVVLIFGSCT